MEYKYTVEVAEIWKNCFQVTSSKPLTGDECRKIVNNCGCGPGESEGCEVEEVDNGFEYSDTMDTEHWIVQDEQGNYL